MKDKASNSFLEKVRLDNKNRIANKSDLIQDYITALTGFCPDYNKSKDEIVDMVRRSACNIFDEIGII